MFKLYWEKKNNYNVMQKFTLLICSLCALVVLGIGLNSCKDEEPFVKPNLKVSKETTDRSRRSGYRSGGICAGSEVHPETSP